ncbi:hypothetical protein [Kangiella taiwanensis]|uniref:DUF2846 domain-containing protein n=1 Tax=Kangiella taiwanensis TaxID=1079179 RepID=A0ABP8HVW2_9GAMM|nr:hypothetical protein [Kangiella taiwanensis]
MKLIITIIFAGLITACATNSNKKELQSCAEVYSHDLSVTSKQHFFPIRFREVNELRVDKMGWGVRKNSSGIIKLEPGKHRLEVFVVSKNVGGLNTPSVIDRQYVDVTVEKDHSYELLAYEKQGEAKTLERSKRFRIVLNKEREKVCETGRIFELPDESIFEDK